MSGRKLEALGSIAMGVVLASHAFLFLPIALYAGNVEELTVSLTSVLSCFLSPAAFLAAAVTLVGIVLPERAARRYLMLLAACSLMLWVQGHLLVWDYGLLDGRAIDWSAGIWRAVLELIVWGALLLFAGFSSERNGKTLILAAVAVFVMLLGVSAATVVRHADIMRGKTLGSGSAALRESYRFSSRQNVLHVVADGVQSDVFEEILAEGEAGSRLRAALDGFVFFREHLGAFPFTHMSVPAILSGKLYRNQIPLERFLNESVGEGSPSILNAAAAAGYEVDLAIPPGLRPVYARGHVTNVHLLTSSRLTTEPENATRDAAVLFDLSLFRMVPHVLKKLVYNDQLWLAQYMLNDGKDRAMQFFAHTAFLRELGARMTADRSTPVYKLMHVMLSHNPMVTTAQCEYAGQVLPTVRSSVKDQARCGLLEVARLFERLKAMGIYDDATIVLMADHGAWVGPTIIKGRIMPDGSTSTINPAIVAMAVPLFAVKPPGSRGPLRVSMAPSSIVDTAATIAAVSGIEGRFEGRNAFDLQPAEQRERRHYRYQYRRTEWAADYLTPMQEFIVNGSVFDTAAWRTGDRFHPEGRVEPPQPE